jgi:hypothetical protein
MAATDERAIHEFPTGTIDENSLLIMDRPTSTPGEYETEKFAIANLGLKLLGGIDFPNNLDTEEQDIFGAINEVNAKAMNISEEYDETASYSKGDYCIYQNAAYRCVKAAGTTTGTFVAADWTQIKVLSEVKANTEEIDLKQDATDNTLATVDKTVVGAINELKSGKADISDLFFGNDGVGYKSISGDATIDNIIDNNISSAGMFSINHGGYITGLVTTANRQFIYGWANSNKQYSWCLICTFGGIWYCKREGSATYTATKLI